MILKKPYAFLIKNFKLIHILIAIPLLYLIFKTGAITSFFYEYVNNNYYTNIINIPGTYINMFMYLAIIVVLLLVLAIYFLMRQKEKETKYYMFLMTYYISLFILLLFCHSILRDIEASLLEAQVVRGYRDIAFLLYLPQFYFVIFTLLRGIGFDIKKFNFEEDAKELEISDIDDEEFELIIGQNAYKYKRTFRRFIREFRYYVLENKGTFTVLMIILGTAVGGALYLNYGVYNRTYQQTQRMTHNNLLVTVNDAVLSNLDLGGNVIDDKYYLAVAVEIENKGKVSSSLDYENFRLELDNELILATLDRTDYFADLGIPYTRDTSIQPGEKNTYVLTYEVPVDKVNHSMNLKILESVTYQIGSVTPVYKSVNLKYDKIYENEQGKTIDFGNILELSETNLGMVQIQLKHYWLNSSHQYTYQVCKGECQSLKNKVVAPRNKILLVFERNLDMDEYSKYYKSRKGELEFTKDFIKVRYKIGNKEKTVSILDITPKELKDYWIFQVPKEINQASNIDLIIGVRGIEYTMKVKR